MLPTIWGVYISWRYMLILDISCQHLGDDCKLEGFCVPFGHRVWNVHLWKYIFVLDICCQQFGEYVSLECICWYWIYHTNTWRMNVREGFCHFYHFYGSIITLSRPPPPLCGNARISEVIATPPLVNHVSDTTCLDQVPLTWAPQKREARGKKFTRDTLTILTNNPACPTWAW